MRWLLLGLLVFGCDDRSSSRGRSADAGAEAGAPEAGLPDAGDDGGVGGDGDGGADVDARTADVPSDLRDLGPEPDVRAPDQDLTPDAGDARVPVDAGESEDAGDAQPVVDAADAADAADAEPLRPDRLCPEDGPDQDGDGLSDCEEALRGQDPVLSDSDRNGLDDGRVVIGERLALGAFDRAPIVELGAHRLPVEWANGEATATIAPSLPAGLHALRVDDQHWLRLEVVRLGVLSSEAGVERRDALGQPIGAPIAGAPARAMAISPEGAHLAVAHADGLRFIDLVAWRPSSELPLPDLRHITASPTGWLTATRSALSLVTPEGPVAAHPLPAAPGGLAYRGGWAALSLPARDALLLVPVGEGLGQPVEVPLPAGTAPRALAWSPQGVLVLGTGDNTLHRVAPEGLRIDRVALPLRLPSTLSVGHGAALIAGIEAEALRVELPALAVGGPFALPGVGGRGGAGEAALWLPVWGAARLHAYAGAALSVEVDAPAAPWIHLSQPYTP